MGKPIFPRPMDSNIHGVSFRRNEGSRYEVAAPQVTPSCYACFGVGVTHRNGCLTAAVVLSWGVGNPES